MDRALAHMNKCLVPVLDMVAEEAKHSPMTESERRDYQGLLGYFLDRHTRRFEDDQPDVTIALFHTCLSYLARCDVPYYKMRLEHFEALCSHLPK